MTESGYWYFLPFLFSFSVARSLSKYQENHKKKGFHLALQEIDYKKANESQIMDYSIAS
jgi:hypothetical protein